MTTNSKRSATTLEPTYEVEAIVDEQKRQGKTFFLIKWKGWSSNDNTWEPIEHLENLDSLIESFRQEKKEKEKKNSQKIQKVSVNGKKNKKDVVEVTDDEEEEKKEPTSHSSDYKLGSFISGDKVHSIVSHAVEKSKTFFELKWLKRMNGFEPFNSHYPGEAVRVFDPIALLDYFEDYFNKKENLSQDNKSSVNERHAVQGNPVKSIKKRKLN